MNFESRLYIPKRILVYEPFYKGSHKQYIDGFLKTFSDVVVNISCPYTDNNKIRFLSSFFLMDKLKTMDLSNFHFLYTSNWVDITQIKVLHKFVIITRMHETFFEFNDVKTNFATKIGHNVNDVAAALYSDCLLFNSESHKNRFMILIEKLFKFIGLGNIDSLLKIVRYKSKVLYLGLDLPEVKNVVKKDRSFIWNHNSKKYKNPRMAINFFQKLCEYDNKFSLTWLGGNVDEVTRSLNRLTCELNILGYVNKEKYLEELKKSKYVISTSDNDNFGISVIEAINCECIPLLKNLDVFNELYPTVTKFENIDELFTMVIGDFNNSKKLVFDPKLKELVLQFDWKNYRINYCSLFKEICERI